MKKNIFILNAHQYYEANAKGELTKAILEEIEGFLKPKSFVFKRTDIEKGYKLDEEIQKMLWADYVIFQFPVFWMSMPWIGKKYIDEIMSLAKSKLYKDDGRSSKDSSKKYGSGGLDHNKKYMLSLTYNQPLSEFDNKNGFYDGLSLDEANVATHKMFQFCGFKQLKTYSINDIFKRELDLKEEFKILDKILEENFLK